MTIIRVLKTSLLSLFMTLGVFFLIVEHSAALANTSQIEQADERLTIFGKSNSQVVTKLTLITGDTVIAKQLASTSSVDLLSAETGQSAKFETYVSKGNRYVIPQQAQQQVDLGLIDVELFNVTKLFRLGKDDQTTPELSVLIKYYKNQQPSEIPGAQVSRFYEPINTQLVTIKKQNAMQAWASIVNNLAISKVWLNETVESH